FKLKSFSVVALETAVKGAGTVTDFKAPALDLQASCESVDLAKLKNILPDIFKAYGLETSGEASFNIQFQGPASDLLSGTINAKADLHNASASSSKFNQKINNVSGTVTSTLDSLSWNNFTGTYLGKAYTLTGGLTDFKDPKVKTTLDGQDVQLKVDLDKKDDLVTIHELNGKYLKFTFGAAGNVTLPPGKEPVLDIKAQVSLDLEDLVPFLPADQLKTIEPLKIKGLVNIDGAIKGRAQDWKNWTANARVESPLVSAMGYNVHDITVAIAQSNGKVSNLTADATAYDGKIHAVGSGDVSDEAMPFDLALNIDGLDLRKLKMDIPNLKSEEINGKFYLTTVGKGTIADINGLHAKGSLAVREGFLTEFKLFKGLFGILNEVLRLGQVMVTDVEGNFIIENQKITTDNLRLKSPSIVLLTEGWVNFDQYCDLNVVVDMTSGIVPSIAEEVLRSLKIHIYDKIANPKFGKKISVPQVINSIIKTIGIFQ
ncbi:MAG: hypothetical protein HY591_06610, partial [Candidatus Omnitrophica bacterium]|nr:hypothetical protein [Candidatus Omnitrophota bacterium]